jgi:hypothetical protein
MSAVRVGKECVGRGSEQLEPVEQDEAELDELPLRADEGVSSAFVGSFLLIDLISLDT